MKTPNIVVVGSLNMDLVVSSRRMPRVGETIEGEAIHYIPGGKGANQAVGCGKLGANVAMIGAVGDDAFGSQLIDGLGQAGVKTDAVARLPGVPTGTATILHTPEDNCIVIVPGANAHVSPDAIERSRAIIEAADLLLVQLENPLPAVERALAIARAAGVAAILNPAPAKALPDELIALADWVTPNETEFAALVGESDAGAVQDDASLAAAIERWEARYGNRLVVTLGSRGAATALDGRLVVAPAPRVTPVDTTGAGDCLNAAFAFGIASGQPAEDALAFAVRAASLSVTRFGAQAGMPTRAEVEAAFPEAPRGTDA
ncbi:ribokinase [Paenibacillus antri]|uniref:Ribokinase n=1 Tax=Paenibacillus antri TaxID=2582848 RepID=A0A5R9FZW6_9BACL|nr:ribokinase [Paenibacillus antri]TLS49602.1 ribokinase [Paenibacillus antri]